MKEKKISFDIDYALLCFRFISSRTQDRAVQTSNQSVESRNKAAAPIPKTEDTPASVAHAGWLGYIAKQQDIS